MRGVCLSVALLAACNPHSESLPRPTCISARHDCRPGEACQAGHCWAEGFVTLVVSAPGLRRVRGAVVALPAAGQTLVGAPHARVAAAVQDAPVENGMATLRFNELPRLHLHALLWDGDRERPCPSVRGTSMPIPARSRASLRAALIGDWTEAGCYELPPELTHIDRRYFSRGR